MRVLASCWIGVLGTLAGCCPQHSTSTSEAKTKVKAAICSEDDCCSSVTRAGLLKKSAEKKQDTVESQSQ